MAGTETKRIIELTEASTVQSGDFIAVDSNARGTKKVSTDTLATSAALTAETNARTGADEQMSERMDGIEEQTALIQNPTKTVSGALCSFTDGADMPMVACTAEIVPKQSGSGTPSPSNVRQISGASRVRVYVGAKNLLKFRNITEETINGVTFTVNDDGTVTANGTASGGNAIFYPTYNTGNEEFHLPSGRYVFSGAPSDSGVAMFCYARERVGGGSVASYTDNGSGVTINVADGNILNTFICVVNDGVTVNNVVFKPMVRLATDADAEYASAVGSTTNVSLEQTVYGGQAEIIGGELTLTKVAVDLGTLSWGYNASLGLFNVESPANSPAVNDSANMRAICEQYDNQTGVPLASMPDGSFIMNSSRFSSTRKVIAIKDSRYTDPTAFKTAVSGVKLVYNLATPQTYTLTGQEVETLLGENNVWADSGDVEITYRRDISIVLENLENALSGSNSLNTMMMSAPTENTAEEPTEDEAEDDMR